MGLIGWALQRLVLERLRARRPARARALDLRTLDYSRQPPARPGFRRGHPLARALSSATSRHDGSVSLTDDIAIGKLGGARHGRCGRAASGGIPDLSQSDADRSSGPRHCRGFRHGRIVTVGVNARRVNAIAAAIAMSRPWRSPALFSVCGRLSILMPARLELIFAFEASVIGGGRGRSGARWPAALCLALRRVRARSSLRKASSSPATSPSLPFCLRGCFLEILASASGRRSPWERVHERGRRCRTLDTRVAHRDRRGLSHSRRARGRPGDLQRQRRRQAHDLVHLRRSGADVERPGRVLRPRVDRPAGVLRTWRLCCDLSRIWE